MARTKKRIRKHSANLLFVTEDRVLLLLRARGTRNARRWGLPGGQREPDEHPFEAASREAIEEVRALPPFHVRDALRVERKGKRCDIFVCRVSDADLSGWEPRLNHEHEAYRWAAPKWCARHVERLHPVLRLVFASELGLERVLRAMDEHPAPGERVEQLLPDVALRRVARPDRFALAA